jgi:hypothetical protein
MMPPVYWLATNQRETDRTTMTDRKTDHDDSIRKVKDRTPLPTDDNLFGVNDACHRATHTAYHTRRLHDGLNAHTRTTAIPNRVVSRGSTINGKLCHPMEAELATTLFHSLIDPKTEIPSERTESPRH